MPRGAKSAPWPQWAWGHAPGPPLPSPAALLATSERPTPLLREDGFAVWDLWNVGATRMALFGFDFGRPDHLTPFLGFLSHQLPEFSRRHRHGLAAEFGQTGLQLRVGQYRIHRLI